jgi:predicted dehydrogenase
MVSKRLRIGLIGLGNVAVLHLEAYRALSCVEVVAGSDLRKDRLERIAAAYGFAPYGDYEEMLAHEQLDIVCVLTPARTHRLATEAAARRNVHVLCEKPMAVSLDDAHAMIAACEASNVKFFYGASYRFLPTLVKARELIQAGAIGNVQLLMEVMIGGRGPEHYHDLGPRHYDVGGPGGSGFGLVDHGIHLVDTFAWLMNSDVVSTFGRGALSGGSPVTEYLVMNFRNGAVGQLIYNWSTHSSDLPYEGIFSWSPEWTEWDVASREGMKGGRWVDYAPSIRVHGTRGALRIYYYANQLFLLTGEHREQIRVSDHPMPEHFALQMQSFADNILRGQEPTTTGRDGVKALRAVLGAYESYEKQSVISIAGAEESVVSRAGEGPQGAEKKNHS